MGVWTENKVWNNVSFWNVFLMCSACPSVCRTCETDTPPYNIWGTTGSMENQYGRKTRSTGTAQVADFKNLWMGPVCNRLIARGSLRGLSFAAVSRGLKGIRVTAPSRASRDWASVQTGRRLWRSGQAPLGRPLVSLTHPAPATRVHLCHPSDSLPSVLFNSPTESLFSGSEVI